MAVQFDSLLVFPQQIEQPRGHIFSDMNSLRQDQLRDLRELFDFLDADGSGQVSAQELTGKSNLV
jgi:Ca2+-binding EF-hand superfamily protein